jgi:hypothetical protein
MERGGFLSIALVLYRHTVFADYTGADVQIRLLKRRST